MRARKAVKAATPERAALPAARLYGALAEVMSDGSRTGDVLMLLAAIDAGTPWPNLPRGIRELFEEVAALADLV